MTNRKKDKLRKHKQAMQKATKGERLAIALKNLTSDRNGNNDTKDND